MRKILTYLLLFLCLPTLMWGQGRFTISGRVTDIQGAPLPMAGVAVMNSTMGAYTDDEGRYTLSLPAGRHMLVVQLVGYATERREVNVQRNTVQDFQLRETTTTLDNVVVYAKSRTQQLREGAYTLIGLNPDTAPMDIMIYNSKTGEVTKGATVAAGYEFSRLVAIEK